MAKSAAAVPTTSLTLTPVVEEILTNAANEAVSTRCFNAFRATWRMKMLKWGDPIHMDVVEDAMNRLIQPDTYLRAYDTQSRAEGTRSGSYFDSGADGREVTSPDVYMEVLQMSEDMMNAIVRENELGELGFTPTTSFREQFEKNAAWYQSRLQQNRINDEASNVLQKEKVKEATASVQHLLKNLA